MKTEMSVRIRPGISPGAAAGVLEAIGMQGRKVIELDLTRDSHGLATAELKVFLTEEQFEKAIAALVL